MSDLLSDTCVQMAQRLTGITLELGQLRTACEGLLGLGERDLSEALRQTIDGAQASATAGIRIALALREIAVAKEGKPALLASPKPNTMEALARAFEPVPVAGAIGDREFVEVGSEEALD